MRELLSGVGDLGRGFRLWGTSPRLMLLGALPALLVGLVWVALLVALLTSIDRVASALTPFARTWSEPWASGAHVVVGLAVVVLAVVVAALSFTAVVLTVGDPFYERISGAVEARLGNPPPERDEPVVRGMLRAARDGLGLVAASVLVGLLSFLLGLVPVAGAVLGGAFGAVVGGWFLTVELTGTAFDARGFRLRDRRRMLRGHRARALGFGIATWLLFLIPFVAVVAMPAAVAGATVLARSVLPPSAEVGGAPGIMGRRASGP